MVNHIRKLLLILVIGLLGLTAHNLSGKFKKIGGKVQINPLDKEVDVEIKNFKLIHEVSGTEEWELKAELAQINNENNTTRLKKVEFNFNKDRDRDFKVWADRGTYQSITKDIHLEGNVKMLGSPRLIGKHLNTGSSKEETGSKGKS